LPSPGSKETFDSLAAFFVFLLPVCFYFYAFEDTLASGTAKKLIKISHIGLSTGHVHKMKTSKSANVKDFPVLYLLKNTLSCYMGSCQYFM